MKRIDLIKTIEGLGCEFVRHGGKHDWYRNRATGMSQRFRVIERSTNGLAGRSFEC